MVDADEVIDFWTREVGPGRWYDADATLDATIAARFGAAVEAAAKGDLDRWILTPRGALALLLLLDQFPRNIHRGTAAAFRSDAHAVALAKRALSVGHDRKIPEPERQFFYLPLMHSEFLADQDRCVRVVLIRMPATGAETLRTAIGHRDVIRRFGRFPARNAALGRRNTPLEAEYLREKSRHAAQ